MILVREETALMSAEVKKTFRIVYGGGGGKAGNFGPRGSWVRLPVFSHQIRLLLLMPLRWLHPVNAPLLFFGFFYPPDCIQVTWPPLNLARSVYPRMLKLPRHGVGPTSNYST